MVQNQKKDIDLETYRMYLNSYAKMQLQIRISVKLHYAENIHDLKMTFDAICKILHLHASNCRKSSSSTNIAFTFTLFIW